jgi:hypothetical protein
MILPCSSNIKLIFRIFCCSGITLRIIATRQWSKREQVGVFRPIPVGIDYLLVDAAIIW